jgi:hypothetical protein
MKTLLITSLLLFTISLNAQVSKNKTITINPALSFQNYEHFKRLTLDSPDSHIEYLENFEFAWGYTYVINVIEIKLKNEWSDGTGYEYNIKKLVSKTKMPDSTEFKLTLDANRYYYKVDSSEQDMSMTIKEINDSTFLYFDKVEMEVPEELIKEFNLVREGVITKKGTFIFIDDKRIRLIKL